MTIDTDESRLLDALRNELLARDLDEPHVGQLVGLFEAAGIVGKHAPALQRALRLSAEFGVGLIEVRYALDPVVLHVRPHADRAKVIDQSYIRLVLEKLQPVQGDPADVHQDLNDFCSYVESRGIHRRVALPLTRLVVLVFRLSKEAPLLQAQMNLGVEFGNGLMRLLKIFDVKLAASELEGRWKKQAGN